MSLIDPRESRAAHPLKQIPIDGEELDVVEPGTGVKKRVMRLNTCVWGMASQLLEMIVEQTAQRVVDKMEAQIAARTADEAKRAAAAEADEHTGPGQDVPEGDRAVWRPGDGV